jgi:hypothetical protein
MRILVALIPLIAAIGCGSTSDTNGAGEKACQDLAAKFAACNLTTQGTCNTAQPCAVECAAKADCSQLTGAPSGSYLECIIVCSGGSAKDFVCKDGAHFVKAAEHCDGHPQCPDESDEADCGTAGGQGGVSSGSGGTPNDSGGAGGAGGGAGGTAASASPECEAMVAHEMAACPALDQANELRACTDGASLYGPEGCGAAWKSYVDCSATAPFDCNNGPTGCDAARSGYFSCQSQFVKRTGCTRLDGQDAKCSGATPYSFGCLSSIPAGCVQSPSGGSTATFACCPAFPPP